jgi:NADH-quinone oxidoreductase subunit N
LAGLWPSRQRACFIPIGLATAALLTAALAVKPFLYAALLIEIVILLNVPLLSPPGKPPGFGVLRLIAFQTLGMPFILIAGWMLGDIPPDFMEQTMATRAAWMAGFGLIFYASIFPFHTWIPMVAEESHPYSSGFILLTLPTVISLFILVYLVEFLTPIAQPGTWLSLRFLGLLMVIIGSAWCAMQNHLGRMMGFAVIFEIGLFLVSISLSYGSSIQQTIPVILAQMLPRGIALAVLALALSIIHQKHGSLRLDRLSGVLKKTPIAAISVMLAFFTLAGVPLLAGFPARLMLWTSLSTQSFTTTLLILIASLGILAAGLRTLGTLITGSSEQDWELNENRPQTWFLILGWVMLFLIGIFPQVFLDPLIRQAAVFAF